MFRSTGRDLDDMGEEFEDALVDIDPAFKEADFWFTLLNGEGGEDLLEDRRNMMAAMTGDREVLGRKLAFLFPAAGEVFRARRLLSEYGRKDHEKEVVRVHLAVLKLSGPDLKKVEEYVAAARRDYRDILAWAESQPWCQAMADCDQDAQWHAEGDVYRG